MYSSRLYGLHSDGSTPKPDNNYEWITIGKTFISGAQKVKDQGFPVASNPTPEEIEVALHAAEKDYADVISADRSYDEAQAELAVIRKQADELISGIIAELRLTLRKMDEPSQRRIMRSYGARFRYRKGEKVDDDDTNPVVTS